jgi:hypothetical protein
VRLKNDDYLVGKKDMALLRVITEFNQEDHEGKSVQLKATVEQDLSEL